jgi:hypothetical protein
LAVHPVTRATLPPVICLLAAGSASGQFQAPVDVEMRARLIGVLTHTRLSVEFDGVPAREAFRSLSAALATPIIGRYADDRFGHGIEPDLPVTFQLDEAPARLVLELILEQCTLYEPCTWQLRKGFIEVGTKERLSWPAAAETRLYNIRDLMLEPPYFASPLPGGLPCAADFWNHPYACAALTRPAELVPSGGGGFTARKRPEVLSAEIAEGIVEIIEPGNWDYGQSDEDDAESGPTRGGPIGGPWQAAVATRSDKIARIRIWRDELIISAPDFIHRQINGYPRPVPPKPLTEAERHDRSTKASSHGARVIIHSRAGEPRESGR